MKVLAINLSPNEGSPGRGKEERKRGRNQSEFIKSVKSKRVQQ